MPDTKAAMAVLTIAFWASLIPAMAATTTPIPAAIGSMAPTTAANAPRR